METHRSVRQLQLQQFSTPLNLAFVTSCATQIRSYDLVLEPSDRCRNPNDHGSGAGSKAAAFNELDPQRQALWQTASGQTVTHNMGSTPAECRSHPLHRLGGDTFPCLAQQIAGAAKVRLVHTRRGEGPLDAYFAKFP